MRTLGWPQLAVSAVIVACSSDDDDAASVSPEEACDSAATALCDKIKECAPFLSTIGFSDPAQCVAQFKQKCASGFTAPGTSATPAKLATCAADARAATCEAILGRELPESCRTVPGALADGAVCGHDAQCKGKLCRPSNAGNNCGVCSALAAAGGACERDEDCDHALKCETNTKRCVAFGKAGNACGANQPCLPNLGCNNGVCAAPLAAGAPCVPKAGENPCDQAKGEWCHATRKVCSPVLTAGPGGACGISEDLTACTGGGHCRTEPGKFTGACVAPAADGATCDDTSGPKCLVPARCSGGVCTIFDPATCK